MAATNIFGLLGLSGALACLALFLRDSSRPRRVLLLLAAGVFGTAMGIRATFADVPVPAGLRFATMASVGSFAFDRSWRWIQRSLT